MLILTCYFFLKRLKLSRNIISYRFREKKKTRLKCVNFSATNIHLSSYSFIVQLNSDISLIGNSLLSIKMQTKYF